MSFVSERLIQSLRLPRSHQSVWISGIAGLSPKARTHSMTTFRILPVNTSDNSISVTAIVVPRVTCDIPTHPISFGTRWDHLSDIPLADAEFGVLDVLLSADIFISVLLQGRRDGLPGTPTAIETELGWVLTGSVEKTASVLTATAHCASLENTFRRFWEIEESPFSESTLSLEERTVICHFHNNHRHDLDGRFIVALPRKPNAASIGESRTQEVCRFLSFE